VQTPLLNANVERHGRNPQRKQGSTTKLLLALRAPVREPLKTAGSAPKEPNRLVSFIIA
jgi:hypothetical protein